MPGNYSYKVTHVPDQDQKRGLLPSQGSMYCVPTASMNWLMYFANHGLLSLSPGAGNWQSQALYNTATGAIYDLGELMGTDEFTGTGGDGLEAGLNAWLAIHPIVYAHYYGDDDWTPDYEYIAQHAFNGGYVMPVVGWYTEPGCMQRNGGHALSLVKLARSGTARVIGWRDPASDVDDWLALLGPSIFATETYPATQRWVTPCNFSNARWMTRIEGYGNAHIDEMVAFYPQFALTTPPLVFSGFAVNFAFQFFGSINASEVAFQLPAGLQINDAAINADLLGFAYTTKPIAGAPSKLFTLDPVTGESTEVNVGLTSPGKLVVGRKRAMYVINGKQVVCINIAAPVPGITALVNPPHPVDAIAYDDLTDKLVLLSVADHKLIQYGESLMGAPMVLTIPDTVPLEGEASMAVDPTGGWWVLSEASDLLYHLKQSAVGGPPVVSPLTLPDGAAPEALDVDDSGDLFVSSNGQILHFQLNAAGAWEPVADSPYADVEAGAILKIAKTRTNFDPKLHGGPEWDHVLPIEFGESIPDCVADIAPIGPGGGPGGDGTVNVDDLLGVIGLWGPCEDPGTCAADVAPMGGDGAVDVNDLLSIIGAWGDCP
jgi:hypothetical protein